MKNAAILTVTGLFLRGAGMMFRIYIAGRIGAEGMGLYQLILTVYNLTVTLSTAGLTICAARIGTDALSKGQSVKYALRRVIGFGGLLGLACCILLFFLAGLISRFGINDLRATLSLRVLAPSLPFMAVSACLRGYFISRRSVTPNAKAQLLEQLIRIAFVGALVDLAIGYGLGFACAAVTAGNTVSEICSWAYMQHCYKKAVAMEGADANSSTPLSLLHTLAPIAANQYLTAFLRTFENIIIPSCLTLFTKSREAALAQFGALKGMAMPVIFFPFSFLLTLSTLLLPEITDAFVRRRGKTMEYLIRRVMLITCMLSIAAGGVFLMFAPEIGLLLYKSKEIGFYLAVLGPLAPLMYVESMVDSILKGMDEQLSSFKYSLLDSLSRIVLIYALVPRLGMLGFLCIMIYSNLLTCVLNTRRLFIVANIRFDLLAWIIKPVAAILLSILAKQFILQPLLKAALPLWLWAFIGATLSIFAFFVILWLMGGFTIDDIMPKKA